jgi:hypothetical protein
VNLRRIWTGEPPACPGQGTSDEEVSKDRLLGGGYERSTIWSPRQGARGEPVVWNYTSDLESVDCDVRIYWNISPPSRGKSVIVLGRFPSPI